MSSDYDRLKEELRHRRKTRSYIIAGIAAVILIAIIIGIVSIKNYINDPQRDVDAAAKEKYEQAVDYLKARDYETALKVFDSIDSSWSNYSKIYEKRKEAVKGILQAKIDTYIADEDYASLLKFLKKYPKEVESDKELSDTYNDATKKYVVSVLAAADAYIANEDYEAASNVLNEALALIGDNVELRVKLDEIEEAVINSKLQSYVDNRDYVGAVTYLQHVVSDSPEYENILNQYTAKLVETTLSTAEIYANERKFAEAISVIEEAQAVVDSTELQSAKSRYTDSLPRNLIDCYEVSSKGVEKGSFSDSIGHMHENALYIEPLLYQDSYVTYNLDGKYELLSGSISSGKSNVDNVGFCIKVYADDILAYTSPSITYYTDSVSFAIKVNGVKIVKVIYDFDTFQSENGYGYYAGSCILEAKVS